MEATERKPDKLQNQYASVTASGEKRLPRRPISARLGSGVQRPHLLTPSVSGVLPTACLVTGLWGHLSVSWPCQASVGSPWTVKWLWPAFPAETGF